VTFETMTGMCVCVLMVCAVVV